VEPKFWGVRPRKRGTGRRLRGQDLVSWRQQGPLAVIPEMGLKTRVRPTRGNTALVKKLPVERVDSVILVPSESRFMNN